ncbi:hypothetical protein N7528_003666 [Penicillium herquei]|nr:hypothetical protein N7528_003666 [Penicillium herquei]
MKPANRVENEVAMINLAAAALDPIFKPHVIPRVYGWAGATSKQGKRQQGWILQELLPGVSLHETMDDMGIDEKKKIFAQVAKILKGLQDFKLPASITKFGGVTFDENGTIVSAPMSMTSTGPWNSYEASFNARLKNALERADKNPYIKGWHDKGIRTRLDAFIEHGLSEFFHLLQTRDEKSIIHADFTSSNILFDPSSGRITGLIDFDFSCVLHPSFEFLCSFHEIGCPLRGWTGLESREQMDLTKAKLKGFPDPLPENEENDSPVQWKVAKAWEDALENAGCKRPMNIAGMDMVVEVDALIRSVLPFPLVDSDVRSMQTDEAILELMGIMEKALVLILEYNGF